MKKWREKRWEARKGRTKGDEREIITEPQEEENQGDLCEKKVSHSAAHLKLLYGIIHAIREATQGSSSVHEAPTWFSQIPPAVL